MVRLQRNSPRCLAVDSMYAALPHPFPQCARKRPRLHSRPAHHLADDQPSPHASPMIVTHTTNASGNRRVYCWIEPDTAGITWTFHIDVSPTGFPLPNEQLRDWPSIPCCLWQKLSTFQRPTSRQCPSSASLRRIPPTPPNTAALPSQGANLSNRVSWPRHPISPGRRQISQVTIYTVDNIGVDEQRPGPDFPDTDKLFKLSQAAREKNHSTSQHSN